MRQYLALALLATLTLGGCGNRGPLTLPPKPATATASALPATVPSPATAGSDSSTAADPGR
ncbi:MAG: lipoprotein [Candidatus Accumulibacter sp. UW20]